MNPGEQDRRGEQAAPRGVATVDEEVPRRRGGAAPTAERASRPSRRPSARGAGPASPRTRRRGRRGRNAATGAAAADRCASPTAGRVPGSRRVLPTPGPRSPPPKTSSPHSTGERPVEPICVKGCSTGLLPTASRAVSASCWMPREPGTKMRAKRRPARTLRPRFRLVIPISARETADPRRQEKTRAEATTNGGTDRARSQSICRDTA